MIIDDSHFDEARFFCRKNAKDEGLCPQDNLNVGILATAKEDTPCGMNGGVNNEKSYGFRVTV